VVGDQQGRSVLPRDKYRKLRSEDIRIVQVNEVESAELEKEERGERRISDAQKRRQVLDPKWEM
jgi:hypothetical protein